jgi:hypothetical protein
LIHYQLAMTLKQSQNSKTSIMRYNLLSILVGLVLLFSRGKEGIHPNLPPKPPAPAVLIKEIVFPNLPSPFYHFEYDNSGKVIFTSFASEFARYNVVYDGGRIVEMRNNTLVNKDRLQYFYGNDGKVALIKYADSTGIVYTIIELFYQGDKLVTLERARKEGTGFVYDKMITMSYYADGNLSDITYHYLPFNGQIERTVASHFEQYDTKINVDSFALLHDEFFDHLFLLPSVQLQKNNPGKETRTGDGPNYTVDYTDTYSDKNAPLRVERNVSYTGANSGNEYQTNSSYSY